jgi:hypothetical protein
MMRAVQIWVLGARSEAQLDQPGLGAGYGARRLATWVHER